MANQNAATRRGKRELSGICGWFGDAGSDSRRVVDAMKSRFVWHGSEAPAVIVGTRFGLAAVGPSETTAAVESGRICAAVQGHPLWRDSAGRATSLDEICHRIIDAYLDRGSDFLQRLGGDFSLALVDDRAGSVVLAIDRMGVRNLVYQDIAATLIFGS